MINVGEVLETAANSLKAGNVYLIQKEVYIDKITEHLKQLSEDDRYLRFGVVITDGRIDAYVRDQIKTGDFIFAAFNEDGDIVSLLHMAKDSQDAQAYEIGISVDSKCRSQGFASEMFKKAITFAKALGAKRIYTYCLRENKAMQCLARKNDLKVMLEHGDITGKLELTDASIAESVNNLMEFATSKQLMIFDTLSQNAVKGYINQYEQFRRVLSAFVPILSEADTDHCEV